MNTYDERLKNSNIPFINLSKENLILIHDSLEAEQAGNMLFKLAEYLYQGIEPSFETKIEKSVWNNIMLLINRKAEGYFVKASVARENGKKGGRPKKSAIQEVTTTEFDIPNCQIPNTGDLSTSNNEDIPTPQQVEEKPTEGLKTGKNEEIPNEFMEGLTNSTEDEMVEVLMSDEDLIEYVANKFIKTEGEDGYNMFIKLNSTNPKTDEFRVLSNKWKAKWGRYITTEKRKSLAEKITDIAWKRYYQRYREVA